MKSLKLMMPDGTPILDHKPDYPIRGHWVVSRKTWGQLWADARTLEMDATGFATAREIDYRPSKAASEFFNRVNARLDR